MATVVESDLSKALEDVAQRMLVSFEENDADAYRALMTDDAVVWLSYMEGTMSGAQNADLLGDLYEGFAQEMRYENIRRRRTRDGYVEQCDLTIVAKSGASITAGACAVVHVDDENRVTRLDQYFDTKVLAFGQQQHDASLAQPESWDNAATAGSPA